MQTLELLQYRYQYNHETRGAERSRVLALILDALLTGGVLSVAYARQVAAADEADFQPCWECVAKWAADHALARAALPAELRSVA